MAGHTARKAHVGQIEEGEGQCIQQNVYWCASAAFVRLRTLRAGFGLSMLVGVDGADALAGVADALLCRRARRATGGRFGVEKEV